MSSHVVASVTETAERIRRLGIVPIVEIGDITQAVPLMEALCAGGLPVAEITLRTKAAMEVVELLAGTYPSVLVGAGTVLSVEDAARAIDGGAKFIVSPGTDVELFTFCRARGVLALPGVATATEVLVARRAGAALLKLFPAEVIGGVGLLKAMAGPYRDVSFVPSGGVNATNLAQYLALPQVAACGGSWMVAPKLLRAGDYAAVQALAGQAVGIVAEVRGHG